MVHDYVYTLPRLAPRRRHNPTAGHPPGHEERIASLGEHYVRLGLVKPDAVKPAIRRPVRMGGRRYPSAAAAERAVGASRGAVAIAANRNGTCHGLKCEWAE